MIAINIEEKKIITEAVKYADVVRAEYEKYKGEKFSELLKVVEGKIGQRSEFKKPITIRDVNEALWTDTGVNFIFNGFVYGQSQNRAQDDRTGEDISQLYYTNSQVAKKDPSGFASFSNDKIKSEWDKIGSENSVNPPSSISKSHTLADFYKRLSADSKLTFMGKEIDFKFPDGVQQTQKSALTVETVVQLFKHVMAGGNNSIYAKAKTKAKAEVAAEERKKEEEAPLEKGELASAEKYNIRRPKRVRVVKLFQTRALKRFYTNIKDPSLTKIIADYQAGKYLSDGFYGHRTHHTSREAIKYLIKAVNEAKKQGKAGIDYDNAMVILNGLDRAFTAAHDNPNKPKRNRFIQARFVDQLDFLLRLLQFKDGKISNLGVVGGGGKATPSPPKKKDDKAKKKPVVTPPVARKPAPKPREASCWYAQNITFGGEQATSPNTLWARTEGVETFDDWYKKMRTVLNDTRAGDSYTFLTGARTTYRAQISTMGARRSTNINIQCFITIGNALMRVLSALGNTAEMNYSKSPEALETQAAQFLNNGKYEGSLAYECQVTLYKVVMNAMRNISPKILRAASKLKQGGKNKAASDVASLVGDKAAQKIVSMRGPASVKEGLISEIILIKVDK
jgi:hypothetical protein